MQAAGNLDGVNLEEQVLFFSLHPPLWSPPAPVPRQDCEHLAHCETAFGSRGLLQLRRLVAIAMDEARLRPGYSSWPRLTGAFCLLQA